jgi:hypothetical protein
MSISRTNLVNYLENFKVSELKQLNKYFNIRVTRQTGGGSLKKRELIWNLVGGALFPDPAPHPSIAASAARERAAAAAVAALDNEDPFAGIKPYVDAANEKRRLLLAQRREWEAEHKVTGPADRAKVYHHTGGAAEAADISRAPDRRCRHLMRVDQNTKFNNSNVKTQTYIDGDGDDVTKIDFIEFIGQSGRGRLYNPERFRRPKPHAALRAKITVTLILRNPEEIGLVSDNVDGQFNVIDVGYRSLSSDTMMHFDGEHQLKNEVEVSLRWPRFSHSQGGRRGAPNMVHQTMRFLDIKDRIIGTPTITAWEGHEKLSLH